MAVYMSAGASSLTSKMVAIFFPISAFIALGRFVLFFILYFVFFVLIAVIVQGWSTLWPTCS